LKITFEEIPEEGCLHVELEENGDDLNRFMGEDFDHVLEFETPVSGVFDISKKEGTLFLDVQVEGSVRVVCSRCLDRFDYPLRGSNRLVLYPENVELEGVDSDDDRDYYDGEKVDVKEILDEEISLIVPFNPICHDDCKGLCSVCGTNLNKGACGCSRDDVDERFSVLKDLKI